MTVSFEEGLCQRRDGGCGWSWVGEWGVGGGGYLTVGVLFC